MTSEQFDRIAILITFCADYHGGQWTRLYRLGCRLATHYRSSGLGSRAQAEYRQTPTYHHLVKTYGKETR